MTKHNLPERDEVCLCPREISWTGLIMGMVAPRQHEDDCPFFNDDTHAESENPIYQEAELSSYVF
ncbi:hypothetical protein SCH01S_14_00200 [Sphingomonas changbaiensis NBRC 104936]|uniref:Uncharacterized protein n=1 Tax=Sphingomonas changbaiensis NBRC 104936 TaxID=1219043 RepID=A0A0E9MLQ3_9SPHN|nr:hypothetical protein [Sphingomonas changbaiensis]GAO38356.1 hypothetical protein SCH01S_14_00200 [Sphingomonas changbaiensis NBRC 104936]